MGEDLDGNQGWPGSHLGMGPKSPFGILMAKKSKVAIPRISIDLDTFNADASSVPIRRVFIVDARGCPVESPGAIPSDALLWTYEGRDEDGNLYPWYPLSDCKAAGLEVYKVKSKVKTKRKSRDERAN